MKAKIFFIGFLAITLSVSVLAQGTKDATAVTYEALYDEPYSVNKLFIGFQPLYGEVFATNVNAGFGAEASYYLKDKMDFKAHFRKTYSSSFFDLNRDLALHNSSPGLRVQPQVFTYYELGGTYHFKDFEQEGTTTMVSAGDAGANNFAAFRRVSSDVDRPYVSTRSPCLMSV